MVFGQSTQDTRPLFFSSWQKYKKNLPLTALEQQIVNAILDHPDYQPLFEQSMHGGEQRPENPFLHLGLHLAIRDQVALNKPSGIAAIYNTLYRQHNDHHHVEHLMIEPLAACLWASQREKRLPDDTAYLMACKELIKS